MNVFISSFCFALYNNIADKIQYLGIIRWIERHHCLIVELELFLYFLSKLKISINQ